MKSAKLATAAEARNSGATVSLTKKARHWGADGKRDPIGRIAGRILGLTPMTTEQLMRSINHRCAAIVHAFRELGDHERLAKFLEPIDRAREGREPPPDVEATWTLAQHADAMEDVAELRYTLDKSDKNLAALIRAKRESIQRETATLDLLMREQEQRDGRA